MYWFAQDMGPVDRAPLLERAMQARMAADPALIDGFMRVLGHDLPPSAVFTPSLALSVVGEALRDGRGKRLALLAEARKFGVAELRRGVLGATGLRRPSYQSSAGRG